jgi:CRISPR-associated endonuclease Cas1/CRISPR-associated protein Cas4
MIDDDEPLTPVRMLTQYAYCPRLAYLEWVQKEWADNYYTEDGHFTHRRVDAYTEAVEAPTTRALQLNAPNEGLVTKLDVLEQRAGEGIPVEYKRGRTPREGPRPSDRVQLCAQALVLRENGWTCDKGYMYYSDSRDRCEVLIDDELVASTRELHQEMRTRFAAGHIPEPLVNDKRCGDCSLNGICLPEEVNYLRRAAESVRPLWAAHEEGHPLHVSEHGSKVGLKGEELIVSKDGETIGRARLIEVSQIDLHGNVQLSTQALRECARRGIPVLYFGFGNWFTASVHGLPHKNVQLRQAQFRAAFDPGRCLFIARSMITAKIANQRVLLRRNAHKLSGEVLEELKRLRVKAARAPSLESLLGLEGLSARHYFEAFPRMLKSATVQFEGRNRRPPVDPVNAVLSFCYAMLAKEATVALHAIGLDPYQGFYHQSRYGRPSLALDLMEEFRPLIADSVVLTLFNTKQLVQDDFYHAGLGCSLKQRAKKTVVSAFERRMSEELTHPIFGYKASYRRTLTLQARLLGRHLTDELETYPGLETR